MATDDQAPTPDDEQRCRRTLRHIADSLAELLAQLAEATFPPINRYVPNTPDAKDDECNPPRT